MVAFDALAYLFFNAMEILLNGKPRAVPPETTVFDLLKTCGIAPDQVVVELNESILARQRFGAHCCCAGDKIEILTFVGGG